MKNSRSILSLLGFAGVVFGAGWLASRFSPMDVRTQLWYRRLRKPPYNPPQVVFPIVWTALYGLIAYSGWRIWELPQSADRSRALRLWASQLAANVEWTHLFFGLHRPKSALADILLLQSLIAAYILTARKVDKPAAACFYPYAAWVAFATLLNADIAVRNPRASRILPRPR